MYLNLKAEMIRNNISQYDLAKILDISTSTLSEKMNCKKDFKLTECKKIKAIFFKNCSLEYLFETKEDENK